MKTTGEDTRRRLKWLLLVCVVAALSVAAPAGAQSLVGTNWHDLVEQAYSGEHSLYLPWDWPGPGQWRTFSLDGGEPAWVSSNMLQACTNLSVTNLQVHGVTATPIILTELVLTGEVLVQSPGSTGIVIRVAAPSDYVANANPRRGVFWEWSQATNCPDCWGLTASDIPPPTVTFDPILIANIAGYSVYASNLEAESAAAASSTTASGSSALRRAGAGGGGMAMDGEFDPGGGDPCTIVNDASAFYVIGESSDTNHWVTTTWQSCTDHVYIVQAESSLTPTSSWKDVAWMFGADQTTSWTDTNAPSFSSRFYRVVRGNPNALNGGIPYGWAVSYGLDPLDPSLATNDVDGSGYSNWDDFLMGTNPTNSSDLTTVYVDSMNTNGVWDGTQAHPFRYIQDAIECSVPVTSNLAIRVRPGNYYETVSNQHYDFNGNILSKRQYLYIYAANNDWSLSTDPERHIIDSSGFQNGDVSANPSLPSGASAVEFFDVNRARINGFTIRGGQGYAISAGGFFGGGILAYSSTNGPIYISNCILENNGNASTEGGGIFIQAGTNSLIYNTVVTKNVGAAGGILDVYGSQIWNCTVVSNANAATDVGAISGDIGMSHVRNCAVWGNNLDLTFVDADYSTFGSNEFVSTGGHNLSVDPVLVNTANRNYRLQTNTTIRAAGTQPPLEPSDLYGNPRPATSSFDIGANQYTDSLGDGIQDDWKIKNGLSTTVSQASLDFDGDGLNNIQEYDKNTNPNNPDTDGDGISDGPTAPPGSGLQPGPDPNPVTPDEVITIEFLAAQRQAVWQYYINGQTDPSWINQPPDQPRTIKLNNYHIGDKFIIQMRYLSGPTNDVIYFRVPLQSSGALSVVPDVNATPLLQFTQAAPLGQLTPPGGWTTTVWQATSTNFAGSCAGFDDETPNIALPFYIPPYLSVPRNGTNTFSAVISPTNVFPQVIFQVGDTNLASVTPSTAASATQLVTVLGQVVTNDIVSTSLTISGVGAQHSATTLASQVTIDVLPMRTNVTVAPHLIIASTMTGDPPTGIPSTSVLKSYLDTVYGKQANVFVTVLPGTTNTVNYDLDGNGALSIDGSTGTLTTEESAIANAVSTPGAINIYYVNVLTNVATSGPNAGATYRGITYPSIKITFIQDVHQQSDQNLTAHEIGYSLGLSTVGPGFPYSPGHIDRLMWYQEDASDPCRLIHTEWFKVNEGLKP